MTDFNKIVITGGCGFIGSNATDYFADKASEIMIVDNYSRKGALENAEWLKSKHTNLKFVKADISKDFDILKNEFRDADAIIHLAGQVAVTFLVQDPRTDFNDNALGTFNVLEATRLSADKARFIYSSTNKVYGGMETIKVTEKENRFEYENLPNGIPESALLDFYSPYGCSKGSADQYTRDYERIYGMSTTVLRQSCIYGPRQFGIEDQGWVAWFIIASLLKKPITLFGNGKQVRDVLYVEDLVKCYETCLNKSTLSQGKIYNVGGGAKNTMSLLELLSFLEELQGEKTEYSFSDWRAGDQPVYISDISKIKSELGWSPTISVNEGVKKLFYWVKDNLNLFKDL